MLLDLRKIIKKKLKRLGMSVPILARQVKCHPQTIYNYLADRGALGADLLQKVLTALDVKLK